MLFLVLRVFLVGWNFRGVSESRYRHDKKLFCLQIDNLMDFCRKSRRTKLGRPESAIGLLQQAHADGVESDNDLGREPTSDRINCIPDPKDGPSAASHIRLRMSLFNDSPGPRDTNRFTTQEILDIRCHRANPL